MRPSRWSGCSEYSFSRACTACKCSRASSSGSVLAQGSPSCTSQEQTATSTAKLIISL